jgi:hypothetical protein
MSTLEINNIEPSTETNVTISGSLTLPSTQYISGDAVIPGVLVFNSISTPITTEAKIFYSSSGIFYFGNI